MASEIYHHPQRSSDIPRLSRVQDHSRQLSESLGSMRPLSPPCRDLANHGSWPKVNTWSRSEITIPTFPSLHKLSSSSSDMSMRPMSRDMRTSERSTWPGDRQESLARTLLTKSSKMLLKRKSSKLSISSIKSSEWLEDKDVMKSRDVQELSQKRRSKHSRTQTDGYETMLKHSISEPYNFQHLTHTRTQQVKNLKNISHNELVTEFSAIRASQAPRRELKGIQADDLAPRNSSISSSSPAMSIFDSPATSVPQSPTRIRGQSNDLFTTNDNTSIRNSASVDSFTRVSSRSFSSPTPPISPPPRTSSRLALQRHVNPRSFSRELSEDSLTSTIIQRPPLDHTTPPLSPKFVSDMEAVMDNSSLGIIAQAVTTPDDTACPLQPYPLCSSAALADVPEEEEGFPWDRRPSSKNRPSTSSSAIRHAKSFPATERSIKSSASPIYNLLPSGKLSHSKKSTSSDPTLPLSSSETEDIPRRSRISQKFSIVSKNIEGSWEDDIDYCYEHAAEADCAFDWHRLSIHDNQNLASADAARDNTSNSWKLEQKSNASRVLTNSHGLRAPTINTRLSSANTTHSFSPTSTPASTVSSAVTMPGVVTPIDPGQLPNSILLPSASSAAALYPLTPSLLVQSEYPSRLTHEEIFQHKLLETDEIKLQQPSYRPITDTNPRRDYSPRSSGSLLSKCNSQESISMSRPGSYGPRHCSSSSIGSLPELMHSRAGREKITAAADHLATQISSLSVAENPAELSAVTDITRKEPMGRTAYTDSIIEESDDADAHDETSAFAHRQRSNSDSADKLLNSFGPKFNPSNSAGRTRSSSTGTALSGRSKSTRSSYSLFPPTTR